MKQEQSQVQAVACDDQMANTNAVPSPNARVVVPRDQRRGYLARFTLIPETENAANNKRSEKWIMTVVVSLCGVVGPLGGAIIMRQLQMPRLVKPRQC